MSLFKIYSELGLAFFVTFPQVSEMRRIGEILFKFFVT